MAESAIFQLFTVTATLCAILNFVHIAKAGGMARTRSPFSPPVTQKFHHFPQVDRKSFSAAAGASNPKTIEEERHIPLPWKRSEQEEASSDDVVPVPFAADRRRKGKKKQSINSVASLDEPQSANIRTEGSHGKFKRPIFCYYGSSANRRPSKGKFWPENIDPFLCSHLIFAFVDITKDGAGIKPNNPDDLGPEGLYARTLALKEKNPKLKILLAVGGWRIGSKPFLPVIKNRSTWKVWVSNVIEYLRGYGFDGFDMDWEFPGWRGSGPEDPHKFTLLMKDLHEAFAEEARETGKPRLLLTLATASSVFYIEKSYETKEIHKHIDYMLLMTYNFHGSGWEKKTGHPSPLLPHPLDEGEQRELFVLWAVKYWLQQGVPKSKLVVGMPTYGLGWKLTDPSKTGVRAPADGGNTKGKYTEEQGILAHYEICEHVIQDGWQVEWIESQKVPYAYGDGEWVGFESPDSLYLKAVTVLKEGLGGAFIWSVEMDDFAGYCGGPKYPLLRTVNEVFTQESGELASLEASSPSAQQHQKQHQPPRHHHHQQQQQKQQHVHHQPPPSHVSSPASSHNGPAAVASRSHSSSHDDDDSHWSPSSSSSSSSESHEEDYGSDYYDYSQYDDSESQQGVYDTECNDLGVGIHPDPNSCQHFLLCTPVTSAKLSSTRMSCPAGTMYDQSLMVCNHEQEVDCSR